MPKSTHRIPGHVRSTYEFIKAHRDRYSVQAVCRILEVAPSGYYEWLKQPTSNRAQEDARLLRLIRASSSRVTGSTAPLACSSISVRPAKPTASTASPA